MWSTLKNRIKESLSRTRNQLTKNLAHLFLGKKEINESLLNELETLLLTADIGVATTKKIIAELTEQVKHKELNDSEALYAALKNKLIDILKPCEIPLTVSTTHKPFVILMVGINGAGKTTTIGKLTHFFIQEKKQVMLAAGDTFRAAAIEQLEAWGNRNHVPVIAQEQGADSASVIFDALQSAKARSFDILIADTAGRLHTQDHLMAELQKIKRVLGKIDPTAPHEILLVLDATIGQNALNQAKTFYQAMGVTGLVITKLDGTAKGGIIFAIANELMLPIRFVGLGEQIDDLKPFSAEDFVTALLEEE